MTRKEAIEIIKIGKNFAYDEKYTEAFDLAIKALEQEPKTGQGHWIYTLEDWSKWECSECGFTKRTDVHITLGYKFCPNCGCRMGSTD